MIFAIDPGTTQSAFVSFVEDGEMNPHTGDYGILHNDDLLALIRENTVCDDSVAIEMVESYGMPVGKEVFETVYWIGRFTEAASANGATVSRIPRKRVKIHLCNSIKAKDSNVRQALIDRFGVVGTRKNPGFFYGFKKDIWSAYALAVTFLDGA